MSITSKKDELTRQSEEITAVPPKEIAQSVEGGLSKSMFPLQLIAKYDGEGPKTEKTDRTDKSEKTNNTGTSDKSKFSEKCGK